MGHGHSELDALLMSFHHSQEKLVGEIDGSVVCIHGVALLNAAAGIGSPWMLGTDGIDSGWRPFLKGSREWIADVRTRYAELTNYVYAENKKSIQWLEWLGFTVEPAEPRGVNGAMFCHFHMNGDWV